MPASRLAPSAALAISGQIRLAGGREVCFVGTVDEEGIVQTARVVARGDVERVLALPGFAKRGEMLIHNHPSGNLEPSDADLSIAALVHDDGIGFAIVNNRATDLYVVVEVPRAREETPLDPDAIGADLGPAGPVSALHGSYEDRPGQRKMAAAIAQLYNRGGVGLLEAGTGIGKSLGYLVPALRWAAANGERTVVSTNTINLQEQLVGKDLPFLARAFTDQPVRYALLKGWRNYLCLARHEQAKLAGGALFDDATAPDFAMINAWVEKTKDGSLSDLPMPPKSEVWDEVSAEPDLCPRMKCPHYERCFLFRARREAAQADVIVVNHHLLLSDVAVRRASQNWEDAAVLPSYQRLVVDEGHHLEDAAAGHLGQTVTRRGLQRLFNRLDRKGKGLLMALVEKLNASKDLLSAASLDLVHLRLAPAVHAAREKSALLFDLLDTFLQESGQPVVRLTDDFAAHPIWRSGLSRALEDTLGEIEMLQLGLRTVKERIEGSTALDEALAPVMNEMRAVIKRLQTAGDALKAALTPPPGDPTVRWVEVKGKDRAVSLSVVPLELAPILREDLFKRVRTTVITSATLATDRGFGFVRDRLGVDDPEIDTVTGVFPSPFAYREQALLCVPTDVPAPNVDATAHAAAVTRVVCDLATAADGGLFVLFTSHRDVRQMATELRARGLDRRWPVLVHGEETRDALLARFRDSGSAVLLGTASFWEGVDVPGRALRGLVIARLPFRVPTEPVTAAQCEAIEARGGNSFAEYMLPHASLRLKQGFGRLVRTATDRGVVIITDPRLVAKRYGRDLLDGLPPARRVISPWRVAAEEVRRFYLPAVRPLALAADSAPPLARR
ncbi:MAG TPA: helicase C-terminal domain-containing protein [Gemmatimonadaceae bacterium]|nr:helicase C-terminal domain-containing protein [Gemmatimonadaceae bacterium]